MSHHSKLVYNPSQGRKHVNQLTGSDEKSYDHPTYDHDRFTNPYLPFFIAFPKYTCISFRNLLAKDDLHFGGEVWSCRKCEPTDFFQKIGEMD